VEDGGHGRPGPSLLRWSIIRTSFDPVEGHEQAGVRPALIISNPDFNRDSGRATVIPLATARRAPLSSELLLPAGSAGLPADSLLLVNQLRTVSQTRFRNPVYGRITDPGLRREVAIRVVRHFNFDDLESLDSEP
jgi:mRNA interferase MazF